MNMGMHFMGGGGREHCSCWKLKTYWYEGQHCSQSLTPPAFIICKMKRGLGIRLCGGYNTFVSLSLCNSNAFDCEAQSLFDVVWS